MNNIKKLAVAVLAVAGLAGCASTRSPDRAGVDTVPASKQEQVSRPSQSYGSMGGYRYRRLVSVSSAAS